MPLPEQPSFDFLENQPRRPLNPERLFIGLFPDEAASRAAQLAGRQVSDELALVGSQLDIQRYHTTMVHVSDRKRLRSRDEFAVELASGAIELPPFEIVYTRIGSFPGAPRKGSPPKHPLVLLADDGPVHALRSALAAGLRRYGFRVPETFRPHLTLSYNRQFVPARAIEPIMFVASEFVLVHSRLWLKQYRILRRWQLQ